jgi:hypothetical protein
MKPHIEEALLSLRLADCSAEQAKEDDRWLISLQTKKSML